MKFRASIELAGKTATGIEVPAAVVAKLGSSKKPAVRVTIKGYTYRSTVASMGGRFMLPVSAEVREATGVAARDKVDVDVELDTAPRVVTVPADFARALTREPAAKRFFEGLSFSNKQRIVIAIESAKAPETRERRIARSVDGLRRGQA
jgi:bifunctional DNA-binding transcriptional regulator/antitoxin component of YhaV-PrlF toxin-antitoxin module